MHVQGSDADADVIRLAGITVTWLFSVSNDSIRESAVKGLANLIHRAPDLFSRLVKRFEDVDDRNIRYLLETAKAASVR